jgi:hypothetical protein
MAWRQLLFPLTHGLTSPAVKRHYLFSEQASIFLQKQVLELTNESFNHIFFFESSIQHKYAKNKMKENTTLKGSCKIII